MFAFLTISKTFAVPIVLFLSSSSSNNNNINNRNTNYPFLIDCTKQMTSTSSNSPTSPTTTISNNNNNYDDLTMMEHCQRLVEKLKPKLASVLLEDVKEKEEEENNNNTQQQEQQKQTNEETATKKTYWIGLAGGPGSGKTTVAETVANELNQLCKQESVIVIPMDGWHIPQKELVEQYGIEQGMKRRGAPWTFDADKMYTEIQAAKDVSLSLSSTTSNNDSDNENNNKDVIVSLPIYSREISDPVPNGVLYKPQQHLIVIVEGIYMLWNDDEKFAKLDSLWDERWFVKCPTRDEQIHRLVQRSMKTWSKAKAEIWGEGELGARKRVEYNDVQNMDTVAHCEHYADEVILSK